MNLVEQFKHVFRCNEKYSFLHTEILVATAADAPLVFSNVGAGSLWVYHPLTRSFYACRAKDILSWINKFVYTHDESMPEILKYLRKKQDLFIFIVGPTNLRLQIEHTMASFAVRAATPKRVVSRRFTSTALWALFGVRRPGSNFLWRVTGPADATAQEVAKLAIKSMRSTLERASSSYRREHLIVLRNMLDNPLYCFTPEFCEVVVFKTFERMNTDSVIRGEQINHNIKMLESWAGVATNVLTIPGTKNQTAARKVAAIKAQPSFKLN